jgi:hypothetical protein
MKRVITLVSTTIGLLACVAVANAQSGQPNTASQPGGTSNQPILSGPVWPSVGDILTFRVGQVRPPAAWTYLGANGDQHCFLVKEAGTERTVCRNETDDFRTNSTDISFGEVGTPAGGTERPRLSFPLFVGKSWEYTWPAWAHLTGMGHDTYAKVQTKMQITGYEPVTVPAGTFDCFKIEATSIQWGESGVAFLATIWYSPKLGTVKRNARSAGSELHNVYDYTMELVGYTPAQASAGTLR